MELIDPHSFINFTWKITLLRKILKSNPEHQFSTINLISVTVSLFFCLNIFKIIMWKQNFLATIIKLFYLKIKFKKKNQISKQLFFHFSLDFNLQIFFIFC